ncbi:MAG TPA: diacylglycerol kinase family protein [Actinomycetes bacterium]|nr:diacylglycerol kinase family protein [Actinomycetes bacterium]
MTPLVLVTNPAAGGTARDAVSAAAAVLRAEAELTVVEAASPTDLDTLLGRWPPGTCRLVVAGGDGSVHQVVAALHRRRMLAADFPLGLVPLGTGNDLARTLGVPLDPAEAALAYLTGRPRVLDLVTDDAGGVMVNVVHLGVGAEAARRAAALKDRLGTAAYAVGSVSAGVGATGWRLRVTVDDAVVHVGGEVLMVAVANGRTIGGGAEVAPHAQPDDGLLDVVVATSTGWVGRLGFAVALRQGDHVERDDVTVVRGRTVTVTGDPFPVNADGELEGPVTQRTWTVHAGAWSVVTPA